MLFAAAVAGLLASTAALSPAVAAEKGGKGQRPTSAASFLQLSTINAPIAAKYRFRGALVVESGLDIPDAKLRSEAQALRPRLQDAARAAAAEFAQTRYRAGSSPDVETMAARMQAAADQVLGKPGAKLLLVSVMVQPLP
jgi:hypothetical protein